MPKMTRRIGDSVVMDDDHFPKLYTGLNAMLAKAALAGARQAKAEAEDIGRTAGLAAWAPNTEMTIRLKGDGVPMVGLTKMLRDFIEVKPGSGPLPSCSVGWFTDPHPQTAGRLTLGDLAAIHEFGLPSTQNPGPLVVFGRPSQTAAIPSRPWLSQVADNDERAERVVMSMAEALSVALDAAIGGA